MSACGRTWYGLLGKGEHKCAIHAQTFCQCICGCTFGPTRPDFSVYFDTQAEVQRAVEKVAAVMEAALRDELIGVLRRQGYTVIPPAQPSEGRES